MALHPVSSENLAVLEDSLNDSCSNYSPNDVPVSVSPILVSLKGGIIYRCQNYKPSQGKEALNPNCGFCSFYRKKE